METKDYIQSSETYRIDIKDINGNIRDSFDVHNLIPNAGIAGLVQCLDFKYVAFGTSSTAVAASQTALVAEITDTGLQRAEGTVSYVTTTVANDTKQITKTFTATGTKAIEEIGIFSASSGGTMLSRALTLTKTLSNGEQISVTYKLKQA